MAHDAIERSLSEHEPALEQQIREVHDHLSMLKQQLEDAVARFEARAEWGNDFSKDLNARIEANRSAIAETRRLLEIVAQPQEAVAGGGPRHAAKPGRDRHGMRVLPGGLAALAIPAMFLAHSPLMLCLPTAWRAVKAASRSHRALMSASALLLAFGTAAGGGIAANIVNAPPPAYGNSITDPHHRRRHHVPPSGTPAGAPLMADHDGRHHALDDDDQISRVREVQPSPSPTGAPTPTVSPTPTPAPTPTPSPTSSPGGPVGMVVRHEWGPCALPPPNMLQHGLQVSYVYTAR